MKKLTKLGFILGAALFLPLMADAQVLEAIPDSDDFSFTNHSDTYPHESNDALPEYHLGTTMGGTSGLITIPTPDYNEKTSFSISGKGSSLDYKMRVNGQKVTNTKDESVIGLRYYPKPEFELSATNLHYKRTNDRNIKGLESEDNVTSFGMKYTAGNDGKNYCFGFNFAPMSSEDMNNLDIEQLENMRNIYFSFSEEINDRVSGYVNIGTSFTKKQTLWVNNQDSIEIDKKNIVYGGIGVEYRIASSMSLFGEFKVANYRDFEAYQDNPDRHRAHVGVRFGNDNFLLECVGMNITGDDPNLVFGGAIGF